MIIHIENIDKDAEAQNQMIGCDQRGYLIQSLDLLGIGMTDL
jgi:hypothetical protein